jgi:hypothetical protein
MIAKDRCCRVKVTIEPQDRTDEAGADVAALHRAYRLIEKGHAK